MVVSRNENAARPGKKAYAKPSLTKYGKLKDITAGGSGKSTEPSSGRKPRP